MQRWGKTAAGTQRFRCLGCQKSGIKSRPDRREQGRLNLFARWLTGNQSLNEIVQQEACHLSTLERRFAPFWERPPKPVLPGAVSVLVVDATSVVKHLLVALVAQDPLQRIPVSWEFAERESFASWLQFFCPLTKHGINPGVVVSDGQKGLLRAIKAVWPEARLQRCLVHVTRQASLWLTQHPKTQAGQELLRLVRELLSVRTRRQKRRWLRRFQKWLKRHDLFLKERTPHPVQPKKWWYTHRQLRAARTLVKNASPTLFTFIGHPEIPRTTNHVEGGINSRLSELIHRHRGLSLQRKMTLVSWFLAFRQGQKPTRHAY